MPLGVPFFGGGPEGRREPTGNPGGTCPRVRDSGWVSGPHSLASSLDCGHPWSSLSTRCAWQDQRLVWPQAATTNYFWDRECTVTSMLEMGADLLFLAQALWKLRGLEFSTNSPKICHLSPP